MLMYDALIFLVSSNKIMSILQILDMKDSMWEVVVNHAKTCALTKRVNVYSPTSHKNTGVVFNDVGQVTGMVRDGRYILLDNLSEAEKVLSNYKFSWITIISCKVSFLKHVSYIHFFIYLYS